MITVGGLDLKSESVQQALAAAQAPVEHGFAHLKNWRLFAKVRSGPRWATALVGALLVLTDRKVAR